MFFREIHSSALTVLVLQLIVPVLCSAQEAGKSSPYSLQGYGVQTCRQDCRYNVSDGQLNGFVKSIDWKMFEAPGSICGLMPDQFNQIIRSKGQPFADSLDLTEGIKKSKVLVAGETHLYTDLRARTDLIKKFIALKGAKSCVVFELPHSEGGLDHFMDKLKAEAKLTREKGPAWQANEREDLIKYYDSMISFAKLNGAQTFGVDHSENFEKNIPNNIRNKTISENIEKLITNKKCDAVLLFIGKAHETKGINSDPAISEILKKRSLHVSTINIQMTYELSMGPSVRTWDTCSSPKEVMTMTVLKNADLPDGIKITPRSDETMTFKDFDFTLLVPFSQKDYPCSDCVK